MRNCKVILIKLKDNLMYIFLKILEPFISQLIILFEVRINKISQIDMEEHEYLYRRKT